MIVSTTLALTKNYFDKRHETGATVLVPVLQNQYQYHISLTKAYLLLDDTKHLAHELESVVLFSKSNTVLTHLPVDQGCTF